MNKIWAISDIHLPGLSSKSMEKYGIIWKNHSHVIFDNVSKCCHKDDLLLIPGDISWASNIEKVQKDMEYLGNFPCRVIMCSGNHDKWANVQRATLEKALPSNVTWVNDICFRIGNVAISGSCFWEFRGVFPWPNHVGIVQNIAKRQKEEIKLFEKALNLMPVDSDLTKVLMLHVPPIPHDASSYTFSDQISENNIDYCVYGHAHGVNEFIPACDAMIKGTRYVLCSCDWLKMKPKFICNFENDNQPFIIDQKGIITHIHDV